jgi:alpha-1,2-rhamnosyltransferase
MKYYVECTHTYDSNLNSGIQRVVRNLTNLSVSAGRRPVVPVLIKNRDFIAKPDLVLAPPVARRDAPTDTERPTVTARTTTWLKTYIRTVAFTFRHFLAALLPYPPLAKFLTAPRTHFGLSWLVLQALQALPRGHRGTADLPIAGQRGDVLVLLDASWMWDIWPAVRNFQRRGGKVVMVIYDLIPYNYPQFCERALITAFADWVGKGLRHVDVVISISRATGESVKLLVPRLAPQRHQPPCISYFWLGSELDGTTAAGAALPPELDRVTADGHFLYLYVGTVEPRKNHAYALDAFELLWRRGIKARLVIVGKVGWMCDDFIERVAQHPALGSELFMLNNTDDNALAALYQNAQGLLFTSIIEGFGLPIVEALQQGLPVFASDIPVFREIGSTGVTFVDLEDPDSLAVAIGRHVAAGAPRLAAPVAWLSWRDSAEQFWQRIDNCLAPEPDRSVLIL